MSTAIAGNTYASIISKFPVAREYLPIVMWPRGGTVVHGVRQDRKQPHSEQQGNRGEDDAPQQAPVAVSECLDSAECSMEKPRTADTRATAPASGP